jgi:hypothetical protein
MTDQTDDRLNKIMDNLLEDHIDLYNQDRDSSAALGEDIETAKQAIRQLIREEQEAVVRRLLGRLAGYYWGVHDPLAILEDELAALRQEKL